LSDWILENQKSEYFYARRVLSVEPRLHEPREYYTIKVFENGVRVDVVRPQDFACITFEAFGFRVNYLKSDSHPRLWQEADLGRVRVILAPQHVAEGSHVYGDPAPERVPQRLSKPTRLTFQTKIGKRWNQQIDLEKLLDWNDLQPIIHPRARQNIGLDVVEQLKAAYPGIDIESLDYDVAINEIHKRLTGPDEGETALELAGRLVFSTSEVGRWLPSRKPNR